MKIPPELPYNGLIFLGTAGTRFNVINQARASGGMVASIDGIIVSIDPGPGALVRMCSLRPTVDPVSIKAIFLTHRHIDHSGDFNIIAEAMTGGGKKPGGLIALPSDALGKEPVIYSYMLSKIGKVHIWSENNPLFFEGIRIDSFRLRHHGVQCYGFKVFPKDAPPWGILSDTGYFEEIDSFYKGCKTVIANTTFLERIDRVDHLAVKDVANFIDHVKPHRLYMTHFGGKILKNPPEDIAASLTNGITETIAATDGLIIDLG